MLEKLLDGELVTIPKTKTILPTKARRILLSWETMDTWILYITNSLTYQKHLLNTFTRSRLSGFLKLIFIGIDLIW